VPGSAAVATPSAAASPSAQGRQPQHEAPWLEHDREVAARLLQAQLGGEALSQAEAGALRGALASLILSLASAGRAA